ncbi:fibronectin type III domain-containing protein [Chryseobacterium echinoideorum]|uniref:fibronectin type III domain-containing protein n=1 Tax=Chryseobacterium echinoideorum TaxID=1549648 RepID=UPI0011860501|nr:fibronectin type III domain-containing protein [Chryseobacterium echinoideorum]
MKKTYLFFVLFSAIWMNAQTYCTPSYASGCDGGDQINDFKIPTAGFSHLGTGCSAGTYGDFFATQTITLSPTISYNFEVTHSYESQNIRIYADFNNDGTFDETSELIGSGSSGTTMITNGVISIPSTVVPGNYRMRVADRWNTDPTSCDTSGYGEAHDYKLTVTALPTCFAPTSLTASGITANSVTVSWTAPSSVPSSGYDVFYSNAGAIPTAATAPILNVVNPTVTINNLTSGSNYCVWIRSKCTTTDASNWVNVCFATNCVAANVPYLQDFESAAVPAMPNCTSEVNVGSGNNWVIENDPGNGFTNKTLTYNYDWQNNADAWFFTNGINLTAGTLYRIKYTYGNNSDVFVEKMKVTYGTAADVASQNTIIHDYPSIVNVLTPQTDFYTFTPASTGIYYFGFNVYSDANMLDLYVDDIIVEVNPTCIEPTALTSSSVTPFTATVSWSAPATTPANGYEYYLSTSNTPPTASTTATGTATSTTVDLSSLASSTQYYIWVRSLCSATDKSSWSGIATFTTENFCPTVISPANDISGTSLTPTITWDPMNGAVGYRITVGTTSGGSDIINNADLGNMTTYTFSSPLAYNTTYYYTVNAYNAVSISSNCSVRSFTTQCDAIAPPYTNDFSSIDTACWNQGSDGSSATGPSGSSTYWYADGFANAGSSGAAKINLYSTNITGWLITPAFNLAGGVYTLSFDYAMTEYSSTNSATLGSDDRIEVLMSTDNGATWTSIQSWDESTNIPNVSTTFTYTVTGATAQTKFAFYGTSGTVGDTADNDFFVDNFSITSTLSTAENSLDRNKIQAYPNPFVDVLNISDIKNVKSIAVMDIAGRQVKSFEKPSNILHLRELNAGVYLVVLHMNDGTKQTIKAIKK